MTVKSCPVGTFILFFILFSAVSVRAEELRFVYENFPPLTYINDAGEARGQSIELVREACRRLGVEPHFIWQPFIRALDSVKYGFVDAIIDVFRNASREEYLYYSESGETADAVVLYMNAKNAYVPRTLSDIGTSSVGAVRGYYLGKGVHDLLGEKISYVKDSETLCHMILLGRIQFAIGNSLAMEYYKKESGRFSRVKVAFIVERVAYHLAFSKTLGRRGQVLADMFGQEIDRIRAERMLE
ncbi:substrate-binding periplasmic protein [Pseudodesulfovibrio sediminis]|nr:transporter substrate-binding domain-containing protein [Pseudodesulfovibrio sediminis]